MTAIGKQLRSPDGGSVTLMDQGVDREGEYLIVEHRINRRGALNGPHLHPVLAESFTVKDGKMRFVVDGEERWLGPGETIAIKPYQVHQFWNESDNGLLAIHEIRPPGRHWKMFELIHKLETEGKMNKNGIPRNPLWLAVAWECIDGYIAGPPRWAQTVFLGGLAKLAGALGYRINDL